LVATTFVRRLKSGDGGPVYLAGGGRLARSLLEAGLIDELIVKLNPVLLGSGIALAPGLATSVPLVLRSTKTHDSGVVVLRYSTATATTP
jgi:dihydrofolate reductase